MTDKDTVRNRGMNISNGAPLRPRRLDAFEEQRMLDYDWQKPMQMPKWRKTKETSHRGIFDLDDGKSIESNYTTRWINCVDCGDCHPQPGELEAIICPKLPTTEAVTRGIGRVEQKLALATGQRNSAVIKNILADIARELVQWVQYYPKWGQAVLDEYRRHPRLAGFITALQNTPIPDGHNSQLSVEQARLIVDYQPLVRKHAKQMATKRGRNDAVLRNDALFEELEAVGVAVLESEIYRFDPTLGFTFGAFVKQRVIGAMKDYLKRGRIQTIGGNATDWMDAGEGWRPPSAGFNFTYIKPDTFSAPYHGMICEGGLPQHWEPSEDRDELALIASIRNDLHRCAGRRT